MSIFPNLLSAASGGSSPFVNLAVGWDDPPYIYIYDSDYNKIADPAVLPTGSVRTIAFNYDGSLMACGMAVSPYLIIYDTSDWSQLAPPLSLPTAQVTGVAFSPDGLILGATYVSTPFLILYDTTDWSTITGPSVANSDSYNGLAFNREGSLMAIANNTRAAQPADEGILVYETSGWSKQPTISGSLSDDFSGIGFSWDGSLLAANGNTNPRIRIFNTDDWSQLPDPADLPTSGGQSGALQFSPKNVLASGHGSGNPLYLYNTVDWSRITNPATGVPDPYCRGLSFGENGGVLSLIGETPYTSIIDTLSWAELPDPSPLPIDTALSTAYNPPLW